MFEYNSVKDEYQQIFLDENTLLDSDFDLYHCKRKSSVNSSRSSLSSQSVGRSTCKNRFTRIIRKSGRLNTFQVKIPRKHLVYFRDLGNTLVNVRWRWIILTLCLVNFLSFLVFGFMWMFVAYISGDFEADNTSPCVVNTKNFTGYVLLSIETMLTIGYGYRYPTESCMHGWIVTFLQALISVGIQGVLVTAIYVKISKPFTKNTPGIFSKKAMICLRNGKLCFIIRIADTDGKISIGTQISMYFINKTFSEEPRLFHIKQIKIQQHGFPIFPLEIIHEIDSESPFFKISPYELLTNPIEVVVVAEGVSIITGQPSQNRTSFINSDILWGHRFASCVKLEKEKYVINHKNINSFYPFETPLCSAEMLYSIVQLM